MMTRVLLLAGLLAVVPSASSAQKLGYLGSTYLDWDGQSRLTYTAGVADALDAVGVRCPEPIPSYSEIMAETMVVIYQNPRARATFAAKSVIKAMAGRGCRMERE